MNIEILSDKFVGNYCRDIFYRPYLRKLRYLYFGLEHSNDFFVFSDTEDLKFKYCEALQTTGIVKITNDLHLRAINNWFARRGIDRSVPMLVYFGTLMTLLSKISWESPDIKVRQTPEGVVLFSVGEEIDVMIARPCDTYFTLTKLQAYVDKYNTIFFNPTQPSHRISVPETTTPNKLQRLSVSCQELYDNGFLDKDCFDVNLMLLAGRDVLLIKSLLQKNTSYSSGIRIWSDTSQRCLNYGGYYTDANVSLCGIRDNVFLFPRIKPE